MTRVRANRCHGHFPNILLENMLYRLWNWYKQKQELAWKRERWCKGRFANTSTDCLAAQRMNLLRGVYHQTMFQWPSLQSAQREYLPLDMPKLWWIQDMAVHGKSISKPVPIKRLFSQETCKGFNVAQVVNRLI